MDSTNRRRNYESYELDECTSDSSIRRKRRANVRSISNIDTDSEDNNIVASFCGRDSSSGRIFGVIFPCRSYPLDASNFIQMDSTHWVLDMSIFVGAFISSFYLVFQRFLFCTTRFDIDVLICDTPEYFDQNTFLVSYRLDCPNLFCFC